MNILVNGKPAAIKRDSSFEFNLQSLYFSEKEDFSLSIEFPMDIKENREIFGVPYALKGFTENFYPCSISFTTFNVSGVLKVLSFTDTLLSAQFITNLEECLGLFFNSTYIDELHVGKPSNILPSNRTININEQALYNGTTRTGYLSDYGLQCIPFKCEDKTYNFSFTDSQKGECLPVFQIYLYKYLSLLGAMTRFTIKDIPVDCYSNILLCNATFSGWHSSAANFEQDFCRSFPHWTIVEFLDHLSHMFGCHYTIDYTSRIIAFEKDVYIGHKHEIDSSIICDDVTIETLDEAPSYRRYNGYRFMVDNENDRVNDCAPFIEKFKALGHAYRDFEEIAEISTTLAGHPKSSPIYEYLHFDILMEAEGSYLLLREMSQDQVDQFDFDVVEIINQCCVYGIENLEDLPIHPIRVLNNVDKVYNLADSTPCFELYNMVILHDDANQDYSHPNYHLHKIVRDEDENKQENHEALYVGIYCQGDEYYTKRVTPSVHKYEPVNHEAWNHDPHSEWYGLRCPYLYEVKTVDKFFDINTWQGFCRQLPTIDTTKKYTIRIVTNDVLDVNSIFVVYGEKYICKNIKLDITANGISQRQELELYRIVD